MALVPQTKRRKVGNLLSEIRNDITTAKNALRIEERDDPKFTQTYKDGRDAVAKASIANTVRMLGWLLGDLGITPPTAYTDAEIDAINPNIRQFEDSI